MKLMIPRGFSVSPGEFARRSGDADEDACQPSMQEFDDAIVEAFERKYV